MPTSALDLAYGRNGGRVVGWNGQSRWHRGQLVEPRVDDKRIAPYFDGIRIRLAVESVISGDRIAVRFPRSGAVVVLSGADVVPVGAVARSTDPETSHQAALMFTGDRITTHRMKALRALVEAGSTGCTDFDLEVATGIKQTSIGVRRGELVRAGLARKTDRRRDSDTGSSATVWEVTNAGRETWRHFGGGT